MRTLEEEQRLDLVWGIKAIAREIKRTNRQTQHLLEKGELPAGKIGGRWVSTKTKLRARFDEVAA